MTCDALGLARSASSQRTICRWCKCFFVGVAHCLLKRRPTFGGQDTFLSEVLSNNPSIQFLTRKSRCWVSEQHPSMTKWRRCDTCCFDTSNVNFFYRSRSECAVQQATNCAFRSQTHPQRTNNHTMLNEILFDQPVEQSSKLCQICIAWFLPIYRHAKKLDMKISARYFACLGVPLKWC